MKLKREKILEILNELERIADALLKAESEFQSQIEHVHELYSSSARNLVHYLAFRQFDIRHIQKKLRYLGLTRFANAEGHIMASLTNTIIILNRLINEETKELPVPTFSIKKGKRFLNKNTKSLLGNRSKHRRVRIMVTQPTEAAHDFSMILDMVQNGMNCARINCAHDSPDIWKKIIENVKRAGDKVGREVKIAMDLAGPKIRTGSIENGPKVRKFSPQRDISGTIIAPAKIVFIAQVDLESEPNTLAIDDEVLSLLKTGDEFNFIDTRNKKRRLKIIEIQESSVLAHCYETAYIGTETVLECVNREFMSIVIGDLPPVEQHITLGQGDVLTVVKEDIYGRLAVRDEDGNVIRNASISCLLSEVFEKIKTGQRVLFDDGKIEGIVISREADRFDVRISLAKENGSKLKAEKGMNFPDTDLGISGLTKKDKEDLKFIAEHADIVNFSFVNSKQDIEELYQELQKHQVHDRLDVILKIETKQAVDNLASILLAAMRSKHVGVMIARGDLAVEAGWDNIGRIQEDILQLCGAGHIPVIWATQVLENLAKKGLPSRSEITDATTALRAECVMLNKGPYITRAIALLNTILIEMERHHDKNEVMLPKLEFTNKVTP